MNLPMVLMAASLSLQWRHNGHDSISNHQPHHCLLSRLFRRKSKKTSKGRVTGLCVGNSAGTSEFPARMTCNAENVSIWWHHHGHWGNDCSGASEVISKDVYKADWYLIIRKIQQRENICIDGLYSQVNSMCSSPELHATIECNIH